MEKCQCQQLWAVRPTGLEGANKNARGTAAARVEHRLEHRRRGAGGGVTLQACLGKGFPAHSSAGLTFAWPEEGCAWGVCVWLAVARCIMCIGVCTKICQCLT